MYFLKDLSGVYKLQGNNKDTREGNTRKDVEGRHRERQKGNIRGEEQNRKKNGVEQAAERIIK